MDIGAARPATAVLPSVHTPDRHWGAQIGSAPCRAPTAGGRPFLPNLLPWDKFLSALKSLCSLSTTVTRAVLGLQTSTLLKPLMAH